MARKRVTSRLANKQKKELTKQSVVLLILSLLIGAIFLVVVLPNAVRLFFEVLDQQIVIEQDSELPPQPPLIQAPPKHTNNSRLTLAGYAQANSAVYILLDNQEEASVEVDDEGTFEIDVALKEGENLISLYSINLSQRESQTVSYQVNLDTDEPNIEISFPEPDQTFELKENQTIRIEGETKPRARVLIDERMVIANANGEFTQRYHLSEGENNIEIQVIDQAGNEAQTQITIFFRE